MLFDSEDFYDKDIFELLIKKIDSEEKFTIKDFKKESSQISNKTLLEIIKKKNVNFNFGFVMLFFGGENKVIDSLGDSLKDCKAKLWINESLFEGNNLCVLLNEKKLFDENIETKISFDDFIKLNHLNSPLLNTKNINVLDDFDKNNFDLFLKSHDIKVSEVVMNILSLTNNALKNKVFQVFNKNDLFNVKNFMDTVLYKILKNTKKMIKLDEDLTFYKDNIFPFEQKVILKPTVLDKLKTYLLNNGKKITEQHINDFIFNNKEKFNLDDFFKIPPEQALYAIDNLNVIKEKNLNVIKKDLILKNIEEKFFGHKDFMDLVVKLKDFIPQDIKNELLVISLKKKDLKFFEFAINENADYNIKVGRKTVAEMVNDNKSYIKFKPLLDKKILENSFGQAKKENKVKI